ncbi:hypothetical protein KM043_006960 [Ampulex compressa]|nr:hypothetical protein KM043_006960 [Ampulex compressa]
MAREDGPGDDRGRMDDRGDRLGYDMSGVDGSCVADDRWGVDRSGAMAEGNAGEASRSSNSDGQNGGEDSLGEHHPKCFSSCFLRRLFTAITLSTVFTPLAKQPSGLLEVDYRNVRSRVECSLHMLIEREK